ncbi:hypothetical protein [Ruficoccus sp. ZRK36]|uniref:hypothetical protein n=1 Tax=Ruficoccus sp. ZRK36 TaxID=2866311 RepID=UPI001C73D62F|nr:hypothetical protein [Ruficoccus sp. ZRK36]QYY35579.1 hypothetical protein K0V07_14930 [Ruficoccus sp. ZRK36]
MKFVGPWRNYTLLLLLCVMFGVRAHAAELNKPNETITEYVVGFDEDPEQAEKKALEMAKAHAKYSPFEIKYVTMDAGTGDYYCRILIEHKIYSKPNQTKNSQATIGYGNSCERAYEDAIEKAAEILKQCDTNTSRINDEKDDRAQTRNRVNDENFWVKSHTFEKFGSKWTCIIKFEYLKDKKAD